MVVKKQTTTVLCPDCDFEIALGPNPQLRQKVTCPNCDTDLELVSLNPPRLSWDDGSDDDWENTWDDDDLDEDWDDDWDDDDWDDDDSNDNGGW